MWNWLNRRKNDDPFDPRSLGAPWGQRPSLFEHIHAALDPSNGRLKASGLDLPDEPQTAANEIRFSAGALDGISTHAVGASQAEEVAKIVLKQLDRAVAHSDPKAFNILHAYLIEHLALSYVDAFNPILVRSTTTMGKRYIALGRHLLRHAADREVVKFAINLIGVCGGPEDHPSLLVLGAHDEFTLFAVVAMGHSGGELGATWEMAKRVTGWGRIQCVQRLDRPIDDPKLRRWLLTEGFNNTIMTEYTAGICARRGVLLEALFTSDVDRGLIDGAAEILAALARGNPGDGMAGYDQSAPATHRLLAIIEAHDAPSIEWLLSTRDINQFALPQPPGDDTPGWTTQDRTRCTRAAARIRSRPIWHQLVAAALESEDDLRFNHAAEAASVIGVDPWEHRFRRLQAGRDQWYWLMESRDESRISRMLDHAATHIDLQRISTGYGDALGFGPGFEEHTKLEWILQALERWPGRGEAFIIAGFQSPVVRNRWGATRAALRWDTAARRTLLKPAQILHPMEENTELKSALARLLAGEVDPPDAGDVGT